jgi:hypothetical protein
MRLLNVHSFKFEVYEHPNVPRYAAASHRWVEPTEATFSDVRKQRNTDTLGYKKVEGFASFLRAHAPDIDWLWIDTCCVDQKSSQEVNEAVNSMFNWYKRAAVCIAYLADVRSSADTQSDDCMSEFQKSVWFTRGWTLQELLAPEIVIFLAQRWEVIGHKGDHGSTKLLFHPGPSLNRVIAQITGIREMVLIDYEHSTTLTFEDKLKWAVNRNTTKEEDMVYCLLGIFEVHMYLIYGERVQEAFSRLKDAIERKRLKRKVESIEASGYDNPLHQPLESWLIFRFNSDDIYRAVFKRASQLNSRYSLLPQFSVHRDSSQQCANIPEDRNPRFFGHENLMQRIDEHLSPANKASPAAFLSLCGNGGSGKTQIAMEYAWRQHSNGLDAVLWVRAESSMSVTQGVNDIAVTHLRFSKAKSAPGAYAVNSALVREWLRTTCESSGT